jgi:hypothetical protein
MRTPDAAARRISQFLLSRVDLTPPLSWQELDERLSRGTLNDDALLGAMERDHVEWEEARQEFRLRIQELEAERTDLIVDRAADAEQIDRLQSQVRNLQKALAAASVYVVPEAAEDDLDLYPDSCVEAVSLARELLHYLNVSASLDRAAALDASDRSLDWAKRVWTLLRGLNDYARHVSSGQLRSGLADYCRNPPLGAFQLNWSKVALRESESTEGNPMCRRARSFPVPVAVNPVGEEIMFPHLKVDNFPPAPRVHFLDTARQIGQVVVGYVGPHLPTAS